MERRLLLAIVLSFLVIFGSNYFMAKKAKEKAPVKKSEEQETKVKEKTEEFGETFEAEEAKKEQALALPSEEELKEVTVKTELFTAVFTNYGGRLKSFKLNEYKVEQKPDSDLIDLITVTELKYLPFDIHFFTSQNTKSLTGNEMYSHDTDSIDITDDASNNRLVFSFLTNDGLEVKKIYTFSNDKYNIDLDVQIKNTSSNDIFGKMNVNWVEFFLADKKDRYATVETFSFYNDEVERATVKDLNKKEQVIAGDIKWSGYLSKFFMVAIIPELTEGTSFYANKISENLYLIRVTTGNVSLKSGEAKLIKHKLYVGPKKSENLKQYGVGLQSAINYGFFSIIAVPLMEVLKFLYRFTHNYGLAIIFLTIIIKIIFYPLTQKSYKAMKDMQRIAPLINELKEKYKDDKERMNKEVLELYKRHRVNPVGGCFPILLQIPVFLALYQVLLHSVELRHAPFYFWITDLSSKDPYYITPIIMGITMFIQQKMSPSAGDKTQQKMMLIMPIVFTFMFLNFAAGLVIYWLVNNVLSIVQQAYVLKKT
jgi:YidC/Oxa1 family membrane protein insertase